MLKTIGALSLFGICVVAAIGLAGGGPVWFRYVGSSTVILLLLAILGHLMDLCKKVDLENASDDECSVPVLEDHLPVDTSAIVDDHEWS